MCRNYLFIQNIFANKSESQAHEELSKMTTQSQIHYEEVTLGLIVSILLEQNNALKVRSFVCAKRSLIYPLFPVLS